MPAELSDFISSDAREAVLGNGHFGRRLPGLVFRSPGFLELEYSCWLNRTWLFVGRASDLPDSGDAAPVPGLTIFLVRDESGQILAFQNACRHRGHRLIAELCQGLKKMVCPYHQWSYALDGKLVYTPNAGGARMHELEGLEKKRHSLLPVRCETWYDWVFINIDGNAEPLDRFVAPLAERLSFVDFGNLRRFLSMSRRIVAANWKICMENTMEPYHVPVIHKSSAAGQPLELHYVIEDEPVFGCAIDIPGSEYTNQSSAENGELTNLDMSARYLLRAPNFFLTSYTPDIIADTMLIPDAMNPRQCWLEQAWYTTSGYQPTITEVAEWESSKSRSWQKTWVSYRRFRRASSPSLLMTEAC